MSHELRTPLNAIIGYSEMLQEDAEDANQPGFVPDLEKIHAAGRHLLALINDILDLSKIEAGKMELYLERFDVRTVLDEVATTIRPLVEQNANRFELQVDDTVQQMHSDATRIRQVLLNLLSNACKFTERGTITLVVRGERDEGAGEGVVLQVRDTGIGMTEDQLQRVFEAFAQAEATTASRYGGTGLGLAISRRFCQMLGGDLSAESEAGTGSTFTVRLPAEAPTGRPAAAPEPPDATAAEGAGAGSAGTVLVIDDDVAVRNLMGRLLQKEGFHVHLADGGEAGLALARQIRPDVITLDVLMPQMDGWAVLTALKADHELAEIPVIMLTIVDEKNLGFALGASEYLTKPIDRERLAAVLKRYAGASGRPVLVVEDDSATRALLRRAAETEGWEVREAENGRAALSRVAEQRPEVILLDLMMPEMDGFEFLEALRAREEWQSIPVLVITAKDLSDEERERLNGGVQRIVLKGAKDREALLAEVRELVAAKAAV
jgi:CheY-like chemotaxis protein/two-component sensor histidine kinase